MPFTASSSWTWIDHPGSGLLVLTHRPVKTLAVASAPCLKHLTLPEPELAYSLTKIMVSKTFHLYSQVVDNIHITELDVRINTREQGGQLSVNQDNRTLELTPEADEAQVAQYDMLFRVMREYKNVVSNVTFWNVYDGDSWLDRRRGNRQRNYPLLFDENLLPKSSYYKVLNF